jgi:hypothetical protein
MVQAGVWPIIASTSIASPLLPRALRALRGENKDPESRT